MPASGAFDRDYEVDFRNEMLIMWFNAVFNPNTFYRTVGKCSLWNRQNVAMQFFFAVSANVNALR